MAGLVGALALAAGWGWSGWLLARRTLPPAPSLVRLAAAACGAYALGVATSAGLLAASAFGPATVMASATATVIALQVVAGRGARAEFVRVVREAFPRRFPFLAVLALAPGLLALGLRLSRGLACPPLAWDALTYHLPRAARWVQEGSWQPLAAPDGWGYYEFFPRAGDLPWAWALLFARDAGLVSLAGLACWGFAVLAGAALARAIGARPAAAWLGALAVGVTAPLAAYVSSAYVDPLAAALVVSGAAFLARAWRSRSAAWGAWSAGATALACAVRPSLLPVLAVVLVLLALPRRLSTLGAGLAAATVVLAVSFGPVWKATGSPLHPFPLSVLGHTLFEGNEELALLLRGDLSEGAPGAERPRLLAATFGVGAPRHADRLGFGPAGLILLGAGALGLRAARRWDAAFVLLALPALLLPLLQPDAEALRTVWAETTPRFLVPAAFWLAALAARVPGRSIGISLVVATGLGGLQAWPGGWNPAVLRATGTLVVPLGVAALGFLAALRMRGGFLRRAVLALATLAMTAAAALQPGVRRESRYPVWASVMDEARPAWDLHRLHPANVEAHPVWRGLDGGEPWRIAAVAGWDGHGQNAYLFPLLGSALQNRVRYVPPTRDGRVVDYRRGEDLARAADLGAWVRALRAHGIEAVVTLSPAPPEKDAWLEARPDLFVRMGVGEWGTAAAYQLVPPTAAARPSPQAFPAARKR